MYQRLKGFFGKITNWGQGKAQAKKIIDPVCGMKATSDLFSSSYQGQIYYFCSDHCKQQFEANPANYVS